jgi:Flp pilus assembly protein CpaB
MVTPEDAERITLAQNTGAITLVLRNPLDVVPTETRGIRMANLMGAPAPPPVVKAVGGQRRVVPAPKPAVQDTIYKVEAIRAMKRGEEVIK